MGHPHDLAASLLVTCLACLACLGCFGCGARYGGGVGEYDHARYPQALDELRRVEGDVPGFSARDRARYALYRGLTHLALGDRAATLRWLSEAKRVLEACPLLLSEEDTGRFAAAWSHLPVASEVP
jgi:hypothetical protein